MNIGVSKAIRAGRLSVLALVVSSLASGAMAQTAPSDPEVFAPHASTVNGAVPPTQLATGTTVTVSGYTTPALHATGLTGGVGNGIVVVGGGGITASNMSGGGLGVAPGRQRRLLLCDE